MSESMQRIAKTTTNECECKGDQDANGVREQVRMGEVSIHAESNQRFN